jgi:homoserine O-acetyltransferase
MLATWQGADIGDNPQFQKDFGRALGSIEARAIVMPVSTDLYFPVDDSRREVAQMQHAELRIIESDWGHVAGGPDRNAEATTCIESAIVDLLATPPLRRAPSAV